MAAAQGPTYGLGGDHVVTVEYDMVWYVMGRMAYEGGAYHMICGGNTCTYGMEGR